MNIIDFNNPVKIHFIGIGGISMSGFAKLLKDKGFTVTGSDAHKTAITTELEDLGITVFYGQRASNISDDTEAVVYTAAVKDDNPELMAAREKGIPVTERAGLVGDIMLQYKNNYSIAGTHGKTTTTSMLTMIQVKAGLDPTVSVGGILQGIGGNMRIGQSDNFTIESCEYTDSFLKFHPTHGIITNIEAEHLDYFGGLDEVRASFRKFTELIPAEGLLMVNEAIPDYKELFAGLACPVLTYCMPAEGESSEADYVATDISYDDFGRGSYTLIAKGSPVGRISLGVIGAHNVSNSIAAAAMALNSGIEFSVIAEALQEFTGTERRLEKKGVIGGVTVLDDYAHHPTEMKAALSAALKYPHKKLWCVFQPHTYSRTKAFLDEISEALTLADEVVLTDIYAAREINTGEISSKDIVRVMEEKYGKKAYYFSSFGEIENFLLEKCSENDLLITMGAGDVVSIGNYLVGK